MSAVGEPPSQAVVERAPQKRPLPVGVLAQRRQQDRRRRGEALAQVLLLAADLRNQALGDRDDRLARELVVSDAQVGGAGLVGVMGSNGSRRQSTDRSPFHEDHDRGAGCEVGSRSSAS